MKDKRNMNNTETTDKEEKMKEQLCRDSLEFLRFSEPSFDWGLALMTVLITVLAVGGFSCNMANLIEMVVEHKFGFWKAVNNIFWATVLLGEWVYHWAQMLKMK